MRFTRTASACARRASSGASAPIAQARSSAPRSSRPGPGRYARSILHSHPPLSLALSPLARGEGMC